MRDKGLGIAISAPIAEPNPAPNREGGRESNPSALSVFLIVGTICTIDRKDSGRRHGRERWTRCVHSHHTFAELLDKGQDIGRELIRRTHEAAGLHTMLILLAAPKVQSYYPHVGMTKHESCWVIARRAHDMVCKMVARLLK